MATTVLYGKCIERIDGVLPYNMTLEYFLNEDVFCVDYPDLKRYGITITKTANYENGRHLKESKTINDIFYRKNDATDFLEKLVRNRVTPITFREIVEEYITSKIKIM